MKASEFYQEGRLDQAVTTATEEVKADPANVGKRCFFSDLLCFSGEWERADQQLDAAAQFGPGPSVAVVLRRQLIRAEAARRQCFLEGRPPELIEQPSEDVRSRLALVIALREGKANVAARLLAEGKARQTSVSGVCNDRPFERFEDLDELTASFFEVFTATGKYYWIPFASVARLELTAPTTTQDLLWRCARVVLRVAPQALPEGVIYLPVLYVGSSASRDDQLKLGRRTDWSGGGTAPFRGLGQRIFDVSGVEIPILELQRVEFGPGRAGDV